MQPVRHAGSNFVYRAPGGSGDGIGDLWCERTLHEDRYKCIKVVYEFDEGERAAIANGARIELSLLTEPIPPMMIKTLSPGEKPPVAEHGWKGQTTDDIPDVLPEDWNG